MAMNKMFELLRDKTTNDLDYLTMGMVNNLRYSDRNVMYPTGPPPVTNEIPWEWFLSAYRESNGFSEIDAIHRYIALTSEFSAEAGELFMGIALVEMKHLEMLGETIVNLGGKARQPNSTKNIKYGNTVEEALRLSIQQENNTIADYEALLEKIANLPTTVNTTYHLNLVSKYIADERLHNKLLMEALTNL